MNILAILALKSLQYFTLERSIYLRRLAKIKVLYKAKLSKLLNGFKYETHKTRPVKSTTNTCQARF
jgi:hypothetical protein